MNSQLLNTLDWLERTTWQASLLVGVVLLVKALCGRRISPTIHYFLWVPVLVRLSSPFLFSGSVSVYTIVDYIPGARGFVRFYTYQSEEGSVFAYDLAVVWLVGAFVFGMRFAYSNWKFGKLLKKTTAVDDISVRLLLEGCKESLSIKRAIRLVESRDLATPAISGLMRPTLILPEGLIRRIDRNELRYIFLHELAHQKNGDLWVFWLAKIINILHWFNPIVRYAIACLFRDCEKACDARVLDSLRRRSERRDYGIALLKLSTELPENNGIAPAALFIFSRKNLIKQRIDNITRFRSSWLNKPAWALLLMLPLVVGAESQPAGYCIYRVSQKQSDACYEAPADLDKAVINDSLHAVPFSTVSTSG